MGSLLFFLFFGASFSVLAQSVGPASEVELRQAAGDLQWLRLLHFQPQTLQGKSEMDGESLFLSPRGKVDAVAELLEFWRLWSEEKASDPEEKRVSCRFPARRVWAEKIFPGRTPPTSACPRLEAWVSTVNGESVSLVFSSYFLNNPASAFGHTFLRLNKKPSLKDGRRYELLDYGVNFAANADSSNALLYSLKGLFGGYPGTYTIVPYYYKVREYNNAESRDLWEYELALTPEESAFLALHLWELGPSYADYWYLSENCSYQMLTLLEAAAPRLDLVSRLKAYVIPGDTLKVVNETPGLIRSFRFRPSIYSEFMARAELLTPEERAELAHVLDTWNWSPEFSSRPESRRRLILDAALDGVDARFAREIQVDSTPEAQFKNRLLSQRSQISEISPALSVKVPELEAPHLAHGSRRVSLGSYSNHSDDFGLILGYRFSFHDLLDPIEGLPNGAEIIFFDTVGSWSSRRQEARLDRFTLFKVTSLSPRSDLERPLSWRLNVALERSSFSTQPEAQVIEVSGGLGPSWRAGDRSLIHLSLGAETWSWTEKTAGTDVPKNLLMAGPQLLLRTRALNWGFLAEVSARPDPGPSSEWVGLWRSAAHWDWARDRAFRSEIRGRKGDWRWTWEFLFSY